MENDFTEKNVELKKLIFKEMKVINNKRITTIKCDIIIQIDPDFNLGIFSKYVNFVNSINVINYEIGQELLAGKLIKLIFHDNIEVGLDKSKTARFKILYFKVNNEFIQFENIFETLLKNI